MDIKTTEFSETEDKAEPLLEALPPAVEQLAFRVLESACDVHMTLAAAESCTGGLLSALLTDVEGMSHAFERGFVVYSEEAKQEMLGVAPELIEAHGAVSAEVALAMANGALARSQADIAIAITGFAGPGQAGDEEGLAFFACIRRDRIWWLKEEHFGPLGRSGVRIAALKAGLTLLLEALSDSRSALMEVVEGAGGAGSGIETGSGSVAKC